MQALFGGLQALSGGMQAVWCAQLGSRWQWRACNGRARDAARAPARCHSGAPLVRPHAVEAQASQAAQAGLRARSPPHHLLSSCHLASLVLPLGASPRCSPRCSPRSCTTRNLLCCSVAVPLSRPLAPSRSRHRRAPPEPGAPWRVVSQAVPAHIASCTRPTRSPCAPIAEAFATQHARCGVGPDSGNLACIGLPCYAPAPSKSCPGRRPYTGTMYVHLRHCELSGFVFDFSFVPASPCPAASACIASPG